jgi:hydrogenase maturation protease
LERLIVDDRNGIAARRVLVIGYGNTLRGDDGVGEHVALAVSKWNVPGLSAMSVHQLAVELAEPIARAELAIFVDAKIAAPGDLVEIHPLQSLNPVSSIGHTSDPRCLLALADGVYGRHPAAWLISVPAADFGVRDGLSATASRGAEMALARIAELIGANNRTPSDASRDTIDLGKPVPDVGMRFATQGASGYVFNGIEFRCSPD